MPRTWCEWTDHWPLLVDVYETDPLWVPDPFAPRPIIRQHLKTGDYTFLGYEDQFLVEWKTLDDLRNCCLGFRQDHHSLTKKTPRERFQDQFRRLGTEVPRGLVCVEAIPEWFCTANSAWTAPQGHAMLNWLLGMQRAFNVPIIWAQDRSSAKLLMLTYFETYAKRHKLKIDKQLEIDERVAKARAEFKGVLV